MISGSHKRARRDATAFAAKFTTRLTARNGLGPVARRFGTFSSRLHKGSPFRGKAVAEAVLLQSTALATPGTSVTCGYIQFWVTGKYSGMICSTRMPANIFSNVANAEFRERHG